MQTERVRTLEQVRAFVEGSGAVDFVGGDRAGVYETVRRTLSRFDYHAGLGKAGKGLVRRYLGKVTGLSQSQLTRLIKQHRDTGRVVDRRCGNVPREPFERVYTAADILLLAKVDAALEQMSGKAVRAVLRRQWEVYGDVRFERLAGLSHGHLYNLRKSRGYRAVREVRDVTRPVRTAIGERRKPCPGGRPGWVRVDTVHQGDLDGEKGVYHINAVDEVTQWEVVGTVPAISERFLLPVLEAMLRSFPFEVKGFHADNGSEFINRNVAGLLNKLHVGEFTKSRPRRSNDNALAESKNGAVVRKYLGHGHIPARFAGLVDAFCRERLTPFLNYHRPCLFPTEVVDGKGRVRSIYRDEDVTTPYEKLKSLPCAAECLASWASFEALDALAMQVGDLDAALGVREARAELFRRLGRAMRVA